MKEREVTLRELLDSREARVSYQQKLLEQYGGVLVSVTLNIPGPVKDREIYRNAMKIGMKRLCEKLAEANMSRYILYSEIRYPVTGPEGYLAAGDRITAEQMKRMTMETEEETSLGRLFDMDVLTMSEGRPESVSRRSLGGRPRKCLLCGDDAKVCARSRKHEMSDLLAEIRRILSDAGIQE